MFHLSKTIDAGNFPGVINHRAVAPVVKRLNFVPFAAIPKSWDFRTPNHMKTHFTVDSGFFAVLNVWHSLISI